MTSPSKPSSTPARPAIIALVALIALTVIILGLYLGARPKPGLVQAMVDADSLKVSAKITARLAELNAQEGQRVAAGDVLFILDSPEVSAKYAQLEAQVNAAKAQANKAQEGARKEQLQAAEANFLRAKAGSDLAAATYVRLNRLFKEGVIARQQRDEAKAQADSAQALTQAAKAQWDEAKAGARNQDKDAANAQLAQALAGLAEVQAAMDETRGIAPRAGEVSKRFADIGELVPAGYPVFSLVDIDQPWVAMYLREDQFAGTAIGQRISGDIPALNLSQQIFEIYFISPAGEFATWRATRQSSGYDVKSFEVRARPASTIDGLRPGMSVLFTWPQ